MKPGTKINLHRYATAYKGKVLGKKLAEEMLEEGRKRLAERAIA